MDLLLHTCCAPCSAAIIERLLEEGVRPVLYYFNPNIFPEEEYLIRKEECSKYAAGLGLEIVDGDYDYGVWKKEMVGLEGEPERGGRCLRCFRVRMSATAQLAKEMKIDLFATSLASSRWKDLEQIRLAGQWAATQYPGVEFLDRNWRKNGLSERRRILLQENHFYNQQYCGCEFSLRKNI